MRGFILGIVFTILVLALGVALFATFGFFPTRADATPPEFERHLAMKAVDAAMERNAPRVNNPVPATDENLIEGMKLYTMKCSECHGTLDKKPSPLEKSFYPPVPQLILDPPDDPEWHIYYTVRTGVRYSGMPAWGKVMTEDEMWKVTAFVTHLEKLPPAVQDYWKKAYGQPEPAPPAETEKDEHKPSHMHPK